MTTKSRLLSEIKQTRPFGTASEEAFVAILRTADLLRRRFATVVEASGITIQQYNVLRILRGARDSGLPTLEIGVRMIEQTPGITRLLDRLEEKALVRRERCPADRRQVLCWITESGLHLLQRLDGPMKTAEEEISARLTEREVTQLLRSLEKLRT